MSRPVRYRRREKGAALVVAILVLAILTVIGIALMLVTSTESRIAANEWSINRAFYASDAGIRWASVQLHRDMPNFMIRPEFTASPFGTVLFQLPSHRHGVLGFFRGDPTETDIQVRVQKPSKLGRWWAPGYVMNAGSGKERYVYAYEVRSQGGQNDAILQYSKALVADVAIGPLPATLPF